MAFYGYDKIPEDPRRWGAQPDDARRLDRVEWVVTEKLHGANLCFCLDEAGVRAGKRRGLLAPGEPFFGHEALLAELEAGLREVYRARGAEVTRVWVYGELYGGAYPHPEVPAVAGVQAVQTGVWYCPEIAFAAFDIREERSAGAPRWLGWDGLVARCEAGGIPYVPARFVGSYGEARQQPVEFCTEVPARRGLPPLADNLAEGVVLKPRTPVEVSGQRPVLKHKHPRFAEDERYHQAQKPRGVVERAPAALDVLEHALLARLNGPRLAAALSKLGPGTDDQALSGEVASDVWGELLEEEGARMAQLSAEDRALLEGVLQQEARQLVRSR